MTRHRYATCLLVAARICHAGTAIAQPEPPKAEVAAPPAKEQKGEPAEEAKDATEKKNGAKEKEEEDEYGAAHSFELGGSGSFLWNDDSVTVELSPSFGYFLLERFELSAIFTMRYVNERVGETDERATTQRYVFVVEPSYHLKLRDHLFLPFALGVGVGYDGDNPDFELIPKVGLNIVFTEHGVLTPAVRVPIVIDSDDTTVSVGVDIGYTVAF